MNREYVIWLESDPQKVRVTQGYWRGDYYSVNKALIPAIDINITNKTKKYSSKARAEIGLKACLNKGCAYVIGGEVREVE